MIFLTTTKRAGVFVFKQNNVAVFKQTQGQKFKILLWQPFLLRNKERSPNAENRKKSNQIWRGVQIKPGYITGVRGGECFNHVYVNLLTKIGLSLLLLFIRLFISYPESPLVFCRTIWKENSHRHNPQTSGWISPAGRNILPYYMDSAINNTGTYVYKDRINSAFLHEA